jgi:hypothetical protein
MVERHGVATEALIVFLAQADGGGPEVFD